MSIPVSALPMRCVVKRRGSGTNALNQPNESLVVIASDVPCRIYINTSSEAGTDSTTGAAGTRFKGMFLPGQDIEKGDVIVSDSDNFEVEEIYNPVAGSAVHHKEIFFIRVS